jgi:hypothetical protein
LPEKGTANSLLAKWKTLESDKKERSPPENGSRQRTMSRERQRTPPANVVNAGGADNETEFLPQTGTAKNLLNKWQNIDATSERKSSPTKESDAVNGESELAVIEKGYARNALAK